MEQSIFSKRVSELIESRGKTPTSVAYDIGITPATMSRYLSDARYPDVRILIKLCGYFNVSMEWILGMSDDRFDKDGADVTELVKLYSLANEDDRNVVWAVLKKYRKGDVSHE